MSLCCLFDQIPSGLAKGKDALCYCLLCEIQNTINNTEKHFIALMILKMMYL